MIGCIRCGQEVAYDGAIFCGAACAQEWEAHIGALDMSERDLVLFILGSAGIVFRDYGYAVSGLGWAISFQNEDVIGYFVDCNGVKEWWRDEDLFSPAPAQP